MSSWETSNVEIVKVVRRKLMLI